MRYLNLNKIKKLYFTPRDLADAFDITYSSAKVTCSRYAKAGLILRIKRNFYITENMLSGLSKEQGFTIANMLEVPSYVSLTTALSYYNISTQLQQDFIESVSVKRTKTASIKEKEFTYSKIKQKYYNSFLKKGNFFIATPEKAFVDALYLMSFNKYKLDVSAIDIDKLDKKEITRLLRRYTDKTKKLWSDLCKS